jgi:hypothetical protein
MTKLDRLIDLINLFSTNLFFRYKNNDGFWTVPATSDKTDDEINIIEHSDFLYKLFFLRALIINVLLMISILILQKNLMTSRWLIIMSISLMTPIMTIMY